MGKAEDIITIKNFSKSFGGKKAVDDLSFEVKKGEIFAFLGANGSGKTTTLRALLDIYQADAGELFINGHKFNQDDSATIGYLPEERGLYLNSTVMEVLTYFGRIKGMSTNDASISAKKFLDEVELTDKANEKVKKLSSGQQQKIQLGITLIHNPKLLILDEPTKGLDPVNRHLLMNILIDLNKKGSTIVFSTHQMDEAEKIADRILLIKDGKKLLYGQLDEVKKSFGDDFIRLRFTGKFPRNEKLYSAEVDKNDAMLKPNSGVTANEVIKYLIDHGTQIQEYRISTLSLDEIFVKVAS